MSFLPIGVTGPAGASTRLRGLVRFDLSQIPANATVSNATLRVQVVFGSGANTTFDLHRMLQSWVEGSKSGGPDKAGTLGAPATTGESDWNHRQHSTVSWGTPGGAANVDFVSAASASITVTPPSSYTFSSASVTSDVQRWVTNGASNFGWLIKSRNELSSAGGTARRFGSREDAANAPVLVVTYSVPGSPPVIATISPLPAGTVGTAYSQTLAASGGAPPYTWSVSAGALPGGLTLSGGGVLSGMPSAAGTFNFTVQVTDSASVSASKAFSVTINPPPLGITTSSPLPPGTQGIAYSQTLVASGGTPPYTWSVSAGALPGGLTLSSGGVLSGTPTTSGNSTFSLQVADSLGATANAPFTLAINSPLRIDQVNLAGSQINLKFTAQPGQSYAVEFRASVEGGNWTTLTNVVAQTIATDIVVADSTDQPQRFYRVRTP